VSDKQHIRNARGETLPTLSSRAVGVRVGDQVYMPALPADGDTAAAMRGNLKAHLNVVGLLDHIYAGAEALAAGRTVVYDPAAEREAREENRAEVLHAREIAKKRRQREIHEAELEVLQAQHRYEAVREFKEVKFDVGHARLRQRVAEAEVGEAVAREGMKDEVIEPQAKTVEVKSPTLAEQFARLVDDLEQKIDEAEAGGRPTDEMRAEQKTLNTLLRRELLKGNS
jgi:hypothetical protein